MRERGDRCGLHIVTAPNGEDQSIAGQSIGVIGAQDEISGRIIGIRIHRVGTVQFARGGKADIVSIYCGEFTHALSSSFFMLSTPPSAAESMLSISDGLLSLLAQTFDTQLHHVSRLEVH